MVLYWVSLNVVSDATKRNMLVYYIRDATLTLTSGFDVEIILFISSHVELIIIMEFVDNQSITHKTVVFLSRLLTPICYSISVRQALLLPTTSLVDVVGSRLVSHCAVRHNL